MFNMGLNETLSRWNPSLYSGILLFLWECKQSLYLICSIWDKTGHRPHTDVVISSIGTFWRDLIQHLTSKWLWTFISAITLFCILKYSMTFGSLTSGSCSYTNFCLAFNIKFSKTLFWNNSHWLGWWSSGLDFSNFRIVWKLCRNLKQNQTKWSVCEPKMCSKWK